MVEQGLRAVYVPEAVCMEEPNRQAKKELAARVRIISQTFSDLWRNRGMMNPFKSGFYAVQLWSHKVMRYLVPIFLIAIFITSGVSGAGQYFLCDPVLVASRVLSGGARVVVVGEGRTVIPFAGVTAVFCDRESGFADCVC